MKRQIDLVRAILFAIEKGVEPCSGGELDLPYYSDAQITEHIELLLEAGFITCSVFRPLAGSPEFHRLRLTWQGHEFLDAVRDPKIWKNTKAAAKKVGTESLSFLGDIAKAMLKAEAARLGFVVGS